MNIIKNHSISIVMPVYNEEGIIEKSIKDYHEEVLSQFNDWEFIIVNDCSKDDTLKILKEIQKDIPITIINNEKNLGHGPSLIKAYKAASKDYIFHTDSDYQFNPKEFWELYKHINDYDFILGYRKTRNDPTHRILLSQIVKALMFLFMYINIKDINSPFRLMKKELVKDALNIIPEDFLIPSIALSIFAKKRGHSYKEVGVTHSKRESGKSSIIRLKLLKFCVDAFNQLVKLRGKLIK